MNTPRSFFPLWLSLLFCGACLVWGLLLLARGGEAVAFPFEAPPRSAVAAAARTETALHTIREKDERVGAAAPASAPFSVSPRVEARPGSEDASPHEGRQLITVRLFLPGGVPCAFGRAIVQRGDGGIGVRLSPAGEDGRFRMAFPRISGRWERVRFQGGRERGDLSFEGAVALPKSLEPSPHDLGDLHLAPRDLLLDCRLVGAPVTERFIPQLYVREDPREPWTLLIREISSHAQAARFQVFGTADPGRTQAEHRVVILSDELRQVSCGFFSPGSQAALNFSVEMAPPAQVVTSVLMEREAPEHGLNWRLEYEGCGAGLTGVRELRSGRGSVDPGTAVAVLEAYGAELWRSDPIELHGGGRTEIEADLRGLLLDIVVTPEWSGWPPRDEVADPERRLMPPGWPEWPEWPGGLQRTEPVSPSGGLGPPPQGAAVRFRESEADDYPSLAIRQGEAFRILSRAPSVDLVVLGRWHEAQWFEDVRSSFRCTMTAGPVIEVPRPDTFDTEHPGGILAAALHPQDSRLGPVRLILVPVGERTSLPATGTYRLDWYLVPDGGRDYVLRGLQTVAVFRTGDDEWRDLIGQAPEDWVDLGEHGDEAHSVEVTGGYQLLDVQVPQKALERYRESLEH